jgi:hypothetical protein
MILGSPTDNENAGKDSSRPLGMTMPVISNEVRDLFLILFEGGTKQIKEAINTYCHFGPFGKTQDKPREKPFLDSHVRLESGSRMRGALFVARMQHSGIRIL